MRSRHSFVATTGAVVLILAVSACTSSGPVAPTAPSSSATSSSSAAPSSAPPPQPAPIDVAAVNTADPEAVAEAVATAAVTWDTRVDTSDFDGIRRATALLTPDLAAQLQPVQHPASGAQWAEATTKRSYNSPSVYTAQTTHDAPPDTAVNVYRAYSATWVSPTGQVTTDPRTRTMYLTLALQPDAVFVKSNVCAVRRCWFEWR